MKRGDAGRIGDVGLEIGDALARLVRGDLVEGEDARAVREQPRGDRIADAARGAGDRGDCARKVTDIGLPIGGRSPAAPAQYISQPPLTLIVAPVM